MKDRIDIIVPTYNEAKSIGLFMESLSQTMSKLDLDWQVVFVDDGSQDQTVNEIAKLTNKLPHVSLLELSRNFGKEIALSAGLRQSEADAAIMIDADLQHPPKYIPEFIDRWRQGSDVVIGVRNQEAKESILKSIGARVFYRLINSMSEIKIVPRATDFRLLDAQVIAAFKEMEEHNRITRGLIDWLGFDRDYVSFKADARVAGDASYSMKKLFKLAMDSFISLSFFPLRLAIYVGISVILTFGPLGAFMYLDKYILSNRYDFTGPASVGVLVVFLVGILLLNLGILGLYVSNIHQQVKRRPLYAVKSRRN